MNNLVDDRIPTYNVEEEYELLLSLPSDKPSRKIIETKKGLKAIKALAEIKKEDNQSWYRFLKKRNENNLDDLALFYRGTKITFRELFTKAEELEKSFAKAGLVAGNEIAICVSNSPELVYILFAANDMGLKVNSFGAHYGKEVISEILDGTSNKLFIASDDNYGAIKDIVKSKNINRTVVYSLADSAPEDPTKCDEYEPELDKYYHIENKAKAFAEEDPDVTLFTDFFNDGQDYDEPIVRCGDLETDFLITYTSGSTSTPKPMIHKNRSLITIAKFHDPELCGNPKIPGLRGLAMIHPDSNTDIVTCISDNLCQGWSVALEYEYDEEMVLDLMFLNKPNYVDLTRSHIVKMAKQYLVENKFDRRLMPFLLALFAVGEPTSMGEEKFINKMLRIARAGSGVAVKGNLKLPFTVLSVGGGDCEHGGIYYTLWKQFFQTINKPKLGKDEMGMLPVPYAVVTALKQDGNGNWVECSYNEPGIVVANSYTNLSCYKNNPQATQGLILTDDLGRKWVSCNVYGYVDKAGGVHVKGRVPSKDKVFNRAYLIDEFACKDTKNILSSSTVEVDGKLITTIQFQPLANVNEVKALKSLYGRLAKRFHEYVVNSIYIRILPTECSYPLTGSGKRSNLMLEQMALLNAVPLVELYNNINSYQRK